MAALLLTSNPRKARLSMPCGLEHVRRLAHSMRDFLTQQECIAEKDVVACELALVEACNNAVLYASTGGQSLPIDVEITCDPTKIQLRIDDHTAGFELPANVGLPSAESETGRGLFIIKSLMDSVHYFPGETKNSLVMTRLRVERDPGEKQFSCETLQEFTRKLVESEQIISDMADELSSCYETLSAIFRCGAELGKTNNLQDFSRLLCVDLLQITGADWYLLRLAHDGDPRLGVFVSSDPALGFDPIDPAAPNNPCSVERMAVRSRHDIWFNCFQNPLHHADPLAKLDPESVGVVHPIFFGDALMGTLAVGKNPRKPPFTAAQTNVVHTFADFLAIQIVNARLQEEQLKSRLISRELEIAKSIQLALLPKVLPRPSGFGLAGFCESARQVGGDFYDVVEVDRHSLLLVIADVMGKGIPAAMFAAILRSLVRAAPEFNQQPSGLLSRVNRLLFEELSEVEMFITAQLVFVDLEKRRLVAASAGHCPLLVGAMDGSIQAIAPDGIPVGILPDATFCDETALLASNSRLLLYTDGLTEAQNRAGKPFGSDRLMQWLQRHARGHTAEQLKSSLAMELKEFQGGAAPYDDQTFLILAEEEVTRREHGRQNSAGG